MNENGLAKTNRKLTTLDAFSDTRGNIRGYVGSKFTIVTI